MLHYILRQAILLSDKITQILVALYAKFPKKISKIEIAQHSILLDTSNPDGFIKMLLNPFVDVEEEECKAFSCLLQKDLTILDIGANIGLYSLLAAAKSPSSKIYSFEPNPINATKLRRNIALNQFTNIKLVEKAVGENKSTITFTVPLEATATAVSSTNEAFTRLWHKDVKNIEVAQIALDDFVAENNIEQIDIIKLDVENYELEVLKGAQKTLAQMAPAIFMEIHLPEVLEEYFKGQAYTSLDKDFPFKIEALLVGLGYHIYSMGKQGVLKVPSVITHPDSRNYLFSKYNTQHYFTPFSSEDYSNLLSKTN